MDATIRDGDGNEIGPLDQRDMFERIVAMEMPPALARILVANNKPCMVVVNELRAVLAPLLANPWREDGPQRATLCVFCRGYEDGVEAMVFEQRHGHAPDCPVLRRDALLGR